MNKKEEIPMVLILVGFGLLLVFTAGAFMSIPISTYWEYKTKMRALDIAERAIDKGLELRLNGDFLRGVFKKGD